MNEGQEKDYKRLRQLGASWDEAMDYCERNKLGNSTDVALGTYLSGLDPVEQL